MKKFLAIFLAAIMAFSFVGCGGMTEEKVNLEELIMSEKWIDIYKGVYSCEFLPGGITSYTAVTWEKVDNEYIKTTSSSFFGTTMRLYKVVEKNGIITLEENNGEYLLVRESEFDTARNTIEYPKHVTKAVVTDKKGETKIMSGAELEKISSENEIKFGELYSGAYVEIIGVIEEISGKNYYTNYNHTMNASVKVDGWEIEIANKNILSGYDIGDRVKITGYIHHAFGSEVYLFIRDKKPTTIEHYND